MAAALKEVGKGAAVRISQQLLSPHLEKIPTLVMLGPPGVGKGTYSTRLAKKFGFAHISMGDLLRNEIKEQTEPGRLVSLFHFLVFAFRYFSLSSAPAHW